MREDLRKKVKILIFREEENKNSIKVKNKFLVIL